MKKVLVTYASKHHSTAEIAERIASQLKSTGLNVEIQPVQQVKDAQPYDAVVLGSAVYMGSWMAEAAAFLKAQQESLAQKDVWLFSSGPVGEGDPSQLLDGWTFPEDLKPVAEQIAPHDITLFHGKVIPQKLRLWEKLATRMVKAPIGDFRDWNMIRAWTDGIGQALAASN